MANVLKGRELGDETEMKTIADCPLTMDEVKMLIVGHKENRSTPREAAQFDYVLSLLERIQPPAPTWPTPVAWGDLEVNVLYWIVFGYQDSTPIARRHRFTRAELKQINPEAFPSDPQGRPMIYASKADAAVAMQILLQEWVSRG